MTVSKSLFMRAVSVFALCVPSLALGSTLPVAPGAYPTIQSAINAAVNGDEVVVPPGEYNEQLQFNGKAITVRSTGGPEATFLYGAGIKGGVVEFVDEEGRDSVLEGFTVSSSEVTAPIVIDYAGPTVRNCIIESSDGFYAGGILITDDSDALIEQCTIRDNTGYQTGAILVEESYATIRRCQILGNYGSGTGGIRIDYGTAEITNCLIAYNSTNSEGNDAGGVLVRSIGESTISDCTIVNNSTKYGDFGGVAVDYGSLVVGNSIIWGNSPDGIGFAGGGRGDDFIEVSFSDVQNGWDGPGEGNIIADPVFQNVETDFRLSSGSPCVDAGSNSLVPEGTHEDLAGHARRLDDPAAQDCPQRGISCGDAPVVDMGAYERCATGHVVFLSVPCHARAGECLLPQVAVVNQCGEIDTGAFGDVEITLASNPTGATLNGHRTVKLEAGVAQWNCEDGLNITLAGCGYTFLATYVPGEGQPAPADGSTAESDSFKIRPGCMDHLSFDRQPCDSEAGEAIRTEVSVRDSYENLIRIDDMPVVLSLGQNPTGATLGGQFFGLTCNGVVAWSDAEYLNITRSGSGYTLLAEIFEGPEVTRGGVSGESEPFDIFGGYPASLVFAQAPHDTVAGAAILTRVELRDTYGNLAANDPMPIELLIDSNPKAAPLGGSTVVTSNQGAASWGIGEHLNITLADAGYTLRARVAAGGGSGSQSQPPNVTQVVSGTFSILPGTPTSLAFAAQPSDVLIGAVIAPPVVVTIRDQFGNLVTSAASPIALSIGNNPGGGTLAGGGATAASNGAAVFGALSISSAGNGYTLRAEGTALQTAESIAFNVLASAPAANPNPGLPPIDLIGDGSAQDVLLSVLYRNALCGLGAVGMIPPTLLGLVGMKRRRRR